MFYIYHIPQRNKIGATDNLEVRMKSHKWTEPYEILETHTCEFKVGDREQELQREYGYEVDKRKYHEVRRMARKGGLALTRDQLIEMSMKQPLEAKQKGGRMMRKLNYQTAEYIRTQYKRGTDVLGKPISYRRLCKVFDVSPDVIMKIIKKETYKIP